jgi:hypothetical protein
VISMPLVFEAAGQFGELFLECFGVASSWRSTEPELRPFEQLTALLHCGLGFFVQPGARALAGTGVVAGLRRTGNDPGIRFPSASVVGSSMSTPLSHAACGSFDCT